MRAAYPYIDDFLPAGTVASLERLGEILGGVRAGDTRRGSEAAAHAALPLRRRADQRPPRRRQPPTGCRRGRVDRPFRSEATAMKELLEHRSTAGKHGQATVGRAVVVRTFGSAPRPGGRGHALRRRTAGSRARSAAAAWRAPRPRRSSTLARPVDARVIRYGISDEQAWDVGPRLWRHHRRPRRAGRPHAGDRCRAGLAGSGWPGLRGDHAAARRLATGAFGAA